MQYSIRYGTWRICPIYPAGPYDVDGDAIFTMASGEYETAVDTVGYLAEDAIRLAVIDAIKNTETMGGCISYNDIFSG